MQLSQVVFNQLLVKIRDGSFRPGDRLPGEYDLMRQLGVGRSSVREAMRGLVALGLVETKPGRGAVVLREASSARLRFESDGSLQKWAILDLLEVREGIEGVAAQLAAERATPADLAAAEHARAAVESQIAKGLNYFRSNLEFHLVIARASQNSLLLDSLHYMLREVRIHRERLIRQSAPTVASQIPDQSGILKIMHLQNPSTVGEHRAILEAIQRKDPVGARQAMVEHIRHSAQLVRDAEELRRSDAPKAQAGDGEAAREG